MRPVSRMVVVLLVLAFASSAVAVECTPISGAVPELERVDANVRLRFLRDRLRLAAHKSRIWTWTWAGIYSTLTVGSAALIATGGRTAQIDNGISGATSLIGLLSVTAIPQAVMSDEWWLERRLRHAPPTTDVCALLADAEHLLIRDAKSSAFGKSALIHLGNFVLNIGAGMVLGYVFGHWSQATIQGLGGLVIGEAMIISQPNDTVDDLERYRAGNLGVPPKWNKVAWHLAPLIGLEQYAGGGNLAYRPVGLVAGVELP